VSEHFSVLVVEDDKNSRQGMVELLANAGYRAVGAASVNEAETRLAEETFGVVITDLKMPGRNGMELVRQIPGKYPDTAIIVTTAFGTVESAVEAMKAGAFDYLTKPLNHDELLLTLDRIAERGRMLARMAQLEGQVHETYQFANIIGKSKVMREVYVLIDKAARSEANVLIVGETGTGKELVARAIHYQGRRKEGPLVEVNCAGFPETLLEAELFGHIRGAFTGALRDRVGRFQEAEAGTLFLDEINNVPLTGQVKLLRAIQERTIQRLGENREIPVSIRLICSSGEDLFRAVEEGRFRGDLFYRINVITIHLPPLRDRKEDIPYLTLHFLKKYAEKNGFPMPELAPETMALLMECQWIGNVRELENALEFAVIASEGETIRPSHLPPHLQRDVTADFPGGPKEGRQWINLPEVLQALERFWIGRALESSDGNITKASQMLGVPLRTLMRRIKEYRVRERGGIAGEEGEDG
jgi:DNA-binding NtrC family response regulator